MTSTAHINQGAVAQRDIFPFFNLPRELRDLIYECDELLEARKVRLTDVALKLETTTRKTNLMLINKQFLREFREAKKSGCTKLVISDQVFFSKDSEEDLYFQLPTWTKKHTDITFNLVMAQLDEADNAYLYVTYCLRQLPLATTVNLRVDTDGDDAQVADLKDKFNKSWLNIPHLATLKVYDYTRPSSEDYESYSQYEIDHYVPSIFRFREPQKLVLELSAETKRVEMVEEENASV